MEQKIPVVFVEENGILTFPTCESEFVWDDRYSGAYRNGNLTRLWIRDTGMHLGVGQFINKTLVGRWI